jgi:hypothetical protein
MMLLALMLDMSAAEFAALQSLPAQARRDRLGMPANCKPRLTAIKGNPARSAHLTVLVTCKRTQQAESTMTPGPPR